MSQDYGDAPVFPYLLSLAPTLLGLRPCLAGVTAAPSRDYANSASD
jgi:hypothetical protein